MFLVNVTVALAPYAVLQNIFLRHIAGTILCATVIGCVVDVNEYFRQIFMAEIAMKKYHRITHTH